MAAGQKAATVLVIDDDDLLAMALTRALEHNGYRCRRASDGDEGLKMAREETPSLILLDFMMPVKSGFDVCRELNAEAGLSSVPVIALTAFGQDIGETYGLSSGSAPACIRDYVEKPYEINVLLERIERAIARRPN